MERYKKKTHKVTIQWVHERIRDINGLFIFPNDEKYFKQINDLPIGLSVSPIIADLVFLK